MDNLDSAVEMQSHPFKFGVAQLQDLVNPKSITNLQELGGTNGLLTGLHSDKDTGLSNDEAAADQPEGAISLSLRKKVYGANKIAPIVPKSFFALLWEALQDKVMLILSGAALVSLVIGIYMEIKKKEAGEPPHYIEGIAILVAVAIVALVVSVNDYRKEQQFQRLNRVKEDRFVKVVRDGSLTLLSVYELVVGDIINLEPGDIIPADAVIISGHNLTCDESMATGESDAIKKRPVEDILPRRQASISSIGTLSEMHCTALPELPCSQRNNAPPSRTDPFLLSGSKVLEGVGFGIVINVGEYSFSGKIMMSLRSDNTQTPLQEKLNALATRISKLGGAASLLLLIILLIQLFFKWSKSESGLDTVHVLDRVVGIFITAITLVVVAIPEGLPLAVTLALAFATVRMLKDKNLVRLLSACETMGNATTICSDKTGTLTQNKMTVVAGTIGTNLQFLTDLKAGFNSSSSNLPIHPDDLMESLPPQILEILAESIAVNSSAFGSNNADGGELIGCKTEVALLGWLKYITKNTLKKMRYHYPVVKLWPFSSELKSMSTLIQLSDSQNSFRFFIKGAPEVVLHRCNSIIHTTSSDYIVTPLDQNLHLRFHQRISEYGERSLRTLGLAFADISLTPSETEYLSCSNAEAKDAFWDSKLKSIHELTFLGVFGIQDPLREGVSESVAACKKAGVVVRMVTGDNILTAKSIATQCGIYSEGALIMEGPEFAKLTIEQMDAVIPRLRILARSSPEDKMILVKRLQSMGEVVAVTGDGTNDAPALKAADIGFSMGITGTEVAKEASSIILMDDNFSSIVKAIVWGRTVNDAIKKFLQFQLTVNITAVILTFVSALVSDTETSALKAVQLLWVNLIMDTLAALALATDPPSDDVLDRPPDSRNASLITPSMWKMIFGQVLLQIIVCLSLVFHGKSLLDIGNKDDSGASQQLSQISLDTVIFNAFVFLQIFNQLNCRRVDSGLNFFKGVFQNIYFLSIFFMVVVFQILIVQFGGPIFKTEPLNLMQWSISVLIGLLSLVVGVVVRLIPDDLFSALGRQSRVSQDFPFPHLPAGHPGDGKPFFAAALVPSLVASSIGAGLMPHSPTPPQVFKEAA